MRSLADALHPQNGEYILTSYGEILSYRQTTIKLIGHYLTNGLKVPPAEAQKKIGALGKYLETNFQKPEDYAEKIPQLATFIGEQNITRLGTFLGTHFFSTLEKAKSSIIEKALPLAKDIHENPFRAPGNDFLLQYETIFQKSAPLASQSASHMVVDLSASSTTTGQAASAPAVQQNAANQTRIIPGEKLLKELGEIFQKAPTISLSSSANPLPNLGQKTNTANQSIPTAPQESASVAMPGEKLLESIGKLFTSAKPIANNKSIDANLPNLGATGNQDSISSIPTQSTLKEFLQLQNTVNKFQKQKDQAGYKTWYGKLPSRGKLILHINSMVQNELKGASIDWNSQANNLAGKTGKTELEIKKIFEEIKAYRKVSAQLSRILQESIKQGLPSANANSLYVALVGLLENKDSVDIKSHSLSMTLLQVTDPKAKSFLHSNIRQLISQLSKWYGIPDAKTGGS